MAVAAKTAGRKSSNRQSVRDRIKTLEKFALENGAWRAKAFSARKVVIDERVRLKCQIPMCPHYGTTITCPPNVPDVGEFKKALRLYETALLVQTRAPLTMAMEEFDKQQVLAYFAHTTPAAKGGEAGEADRNIADVKLQAIRLHKLVNEVETQALTLGFHYALGLIGGDCMLCHKCAGPGNACRRPFQARPAMEGVGIDVVRTAQKAGLAFEIPPKTDVVFSGLILVD